MHINYWEHATTSVQGRIGGALLGAVLVAALIGPIVAGSADLPSRDIFHPPSAAHPLGTNDFGQDVLGLLLAGARLSLTVALSAGLLTTVLSALVGAGAVMTGGLWDRVLMRFTDVMLAVPSVVVIIVIAAYLRLNPVGLILLIALFGWPGTARVIRARTLTLVGRTHVLAAWTFGAAKPYLLYRHILPDLVPLLLVGFLQSARRAVFLEAGLAFLGIGDPTVVSWGIMIQNALRFYYMEAWVWLLLPPALAVAATILAFNLLGNSIEQAVDPRLRRLHTKGVANA